MIEELKQVFEKTRDGFYASLREKDRDGVIKTVERLKESGYDVYAVGSSVSTDNYNDVDLLVIPSSEKTMSDQKSELENVVSELSDEGVNATSIPTEEVKFGYVGSKIEERYLVKVNGSNMDISSADKKFTRIPDIGRVLLASDLFD